MPRKPNEELFQQLRKDILRGRFDNAAFLPSERELAEEFRVGRGAVRNALVRLQTCGLLHMIPRRGACVAVSGGHPRFKRFMVRYDDQLNRFRHELLGLFSGICCAAADNYAEAVFSCRRTKLDAADVIERCRLGDLHGIIFIESPDSPELADRLFRANVPFIIANQETAPEFVATRMDFRHIGRMAGQRLLQSGHKNIGVVAGALDKYIFHEMLSGFRGALAEEDVYLEKDNVFELNVLVSGSREEYSRLDEKLASKNRPDAFFVMRDVRSAKFFEMCSHRNLSIPDDVSVISYDDVSWGAAADYGLTTIRQDVEELGGSAVHMLKAWYELGTQPSDTVIQGAVVERDSVKDVR